MRHFRFSSVRLLCIFTLLVAVSSDPPGSKISPDHAGVLDGAWSSSTR
jgi:hypothetical protein